MTPVRVPTADALMREATAASGFDDFGEPSFVEGLTVLLDSLERTPDVGEAATARMLGQVRQRLLSRLEIERWYRDNPAVAALGVGPTTSITGLPRTGTTALVNLLSLDEEFRCLRAWEQVRPVPPPTLAGERTDPRRLAAIARNEAMLRTQPEMAALHLFDPDATEEDVELLGLSFRAQQMTLPIFDYHAWWRDADMRPALAYHRRVVKLLQSRRPPDRWLFKSPAHNFCLDALFDAYPDTKVVMTHRDPAKVIPSVISLLCALRPEHAAIDLAAFSRLHAEHFRIGAARAIAARARIGEGRFLDVHHHAFVADPFGTVERIYAFLGRELRGDLVDRMRAWHAANSSGTHGTHRYTPEQFGLTVDGIRKDFAFYIERYGIRI